jgi:heat shock protein HslJ
LILPAGGGELVLRNTGQAEEASAGFAGADVTGTVWMWEETTTPTGVTSVDQPEKYTLELLSDGQFRLTADCNSGSGSYTLEEGNISLEIGPMTRAECGPDSLDDEFLRGLEAAVIYFLEGGHLCIDLMYDSGTMRFVPAG